MTLAWHEEPIAKSHERDAFDCGEAALNEFLRRYARKSHVQGSAKTFLAIDDADGKTILGFTVSARLRSLMRASPMRSRAGWRAMTCRSSGWRGWPFAALCRGKG